MLYKRDVVLSATLLCLGMMTDVSTAFLGPSITTASNPSSPLGTNTNTLSIANHNNILTIPQGGDNVNRGQAINTRMKAATATANEGDSSGDVSNEQDIATAAFNLIKGCVGSGVLSLPAGVAAIGDVSSA